MPGDRTVLVEGHTDSTGTDAANQQLSRNRAEAVMARLVSHGVRQSRVRAMGMGSTRPLATISPSRSKVGRAWARSQSRRLPVQCTVIRISGRAFRRAKNGW